MSIFFPLSVNDVVIVRKSNSYDIGDIVVYSNGKEMIVHKLIGKDGNTFTTQGEANQTADDPIDAKAVRGKVVLTLPQAGILVNAFRSPMGMIVLIWVIILLSVRSYLWDNDENTFEGIKGIIKLRQ